MSGLARRYKRALKKRIHEDDNFHRPETVNWLNIQRERIYMMQMLRKQGQQPPPPPQRMGRTK